MSARRNSPYTRFSSIVLLGLAPLAVGTALAQDLPRSFQASPDVYKVIAESAQYRVIAATWKPGQRDQMHMHPGSATYFLTDCSVLLHGPDGTMKHHLLFPGMAIVQPPIAGHSVENFGKSDCKVIMFEPS